jgi:hypothetical protein
MHDTPDRAMSERSAQQGVTTRGQRKQGKAARIYGQTRLTKIRRFNQTQTTFNKSFLIWPLDDSTDYVCDVSYGSIVSGIAPV